MSPLVQQIVVVLLILAAAAYLVSKFLPRKGKACGGGCCDMANKKFPGQQPKR